MVNKDNTNSINNNKEKLKIIVINVNSIVTNQRRSSLLSMLEENIPDIVCLAETKLKKDHVMRLKNYEVIREDRKNKEGGGTAVLIKRNIQYNKIKIYSKEENPILETTIIKIKININTNLHIIAAYATCGNKKEFIPDLENLFQQLNLDSEDVYYIIAGDLNAKHIAWLNQSNNPRGIALDRWLKKYEHKYKAKLYCTETPSYPQGRSYLDLVIADVRLNFNNVTEYFKLPS